MAKFEDVNKPTIEYYDRMLNDDEFYAQEIDDAPSKKNREILIKNTEAYARYKETRPSRLSPEGVSLAMVGAGDELSAGAATAIDAVKNLIDSDRPDVLKNITYEDRLEGIRRGQEKFKEDYPGQAFSTEIGGAIGTGLITSGAALPALASKNIPVLSQGARVLTEIKPGATIPNLLKKYSLPGLVSGGTFGFAEGEGGFVPRTKSGSVGAGIGVTAGSILGGGVNAFKGLANVLSPNLATRSFTQRAVDTAGGIKNVLSDIKERGKTLIEQPEVARFAREEGLESNLKSDVIIKNFLKDKKADQTSKIFADVLEDSGSTGNKLPEEGIFEYQDRIMTDKIFDKNLKYNNALLKNNNQIPISNEMKKELDGFADSDLFESLPDYIKTNVTSYVNQNGRKIFKFVDGKLQINADDLTLTDVEELRRAIARKLNFDDASSPNLLKLKKGLETKIRGIVDKYHPDIIPARKANELIEREKQIYDDVIGLFKDRKQGQFFVYLKNLADDNSGFSKEEIMNIVKRAALTSIDSGATNAKSRATYLNKLVEDDSATQDMLKRIFPNKEFDNIIDELASLGNTNKALFDFTSGPIGSKRSTSGQGFDTGLETVDRLGNKFFNRFGLTKTDQTRAAQILIDTEGDLLQSVIDNPDAPKIIGPVLRRIVTQVIGERSSEVGQKVQDVPLGIQPRIEELYEGSSLEKILENINKRSSEVGERLRNN